MIAIGVQTLFTRALLLIERGATQGEIQLHIDKMTVLNDEATKELDDLRAQNP